MIIDLTIRSEIASQPCAVYTEKLIETVEFITDSDNQWVNISICIPFSGHISGGVAASNALRVYLDGDSYFQQSFAKYWNGKMLLNSGCFPDVPNLPVVSHLSGVRRVLIEKAGVHKIHLQGAESTMQCVTTIKSERHYQVWI